MELISFLQNASVSPRREFLDGREHVVVPITSIVPGVLPGSRGALLYPPEEVSRRPSDWDDVPLTFFHPHNINGKPSSVRDGDALLRHGIGVSRRSIFNGKLQHEGWYDIEKVKSAEKRFGVEGVLNRILKGEPIETSTGLYTEDEPAPKGAHHNGRPYDYVARNYRPDHIALLPNQRGACSLNDGCGINVNRRVENQASVSELVLTLMHAATGAHLLHLQTRSFAAHSALDDLYKTLPEFADAIAESWQGKHGIIANYDPGFIPPTQPEPFVASLLEWFGSARAVLDNETELQNIADEVAGFLDKTLYKLRFLS